MSKKDFKKGMEAGARPYEDKFDQVTKAVDKVSKDVKNNFNELKGVTNDLIDIAEEHDSELQQIRNRQQLGIDDNTDIDNIDPAERQYIMLCLMSVAGEIESNEMQQVYIRGFRHFLNTPYPSGVCNYENIENIESVNTQKFFIRVLMEYLYLYYQNFDFLDEYEVFDYFSINNRTKKEIIQSIENLVRMIGSRGLSEKYGIIKENDEADDEDETEEEPAIDTTIPEALDEKFEISSMIHISEGEEKVISYREVFINNNISNEGSLCFDHCIVHFRNNNTNGKIVSVASAELTFNYCRIICQAPGTDANHVDFCISDDTERSIDKDVKRPVVFSFCEFVNCGYFINLKKVIDLQITDCTVINPGVLFVKHEGYDDPKITLTNNKVIFNKSFGSTAANYRALGNDDLREKRSFFGFELDPELYIFDIRESTVINCDFINDSDEKIKELLKLKSESGSFENCTFCGFESVINQIGTDTEIAYTPKKGNIIGCSFTKCNRVLCEVRETMIKNSSFESCSNSIIEIASSTLEYCKFDKCTDTIITGYMYGGNTISHCEFTNIENNIECEGYQRADNASLSFTRSSSGSYTTIKDCVFKDIDIGDNYLIAGKIFERMSSYTVVDISYCTFSNITHNNDIISDTGSYCGMFNRWHTETTVRMSSNKGL